MKRDAIDFFAVDPHHADMHTRLCNWARFVAVRFTPGQHPMWRPSISNSRQWHYPEPREEVDTLDGLEVERRVGSLPPKYREALRWAYVWRTGPAKIKRTLGVTSEGLMQILRDARQMLVERMA